MRASITRTKILLAAALVLATGAGFLAATALGTGAAGPAPTVTINVPSPSSVVCPDGYTAGRLVINHPGGQTAIWTCLANP